MVRFSTRVVDEHGYAVCGAKVQYQCRSLSSVGSDYTDGDGWVTFDIIHEVFLGGGAIPIRRIWINREEVSDETITRKTAIRSLLHSRSAFTLVPIPFAT
jgi:hypothetical protein